LKLSFICGAFLNLVSCLLILSFVNKFDLIVLGFDAKGCNCIRKKFEDQIEKKLSKKSTVKGLAMKFAHAF
jgi:hypothetical protein